MQARSSTALRSTKYEQRREGPLDARQTLALTSLDSGLREPCASPCVGQFRSNNFSFTERNSEKHHKRRSESFETPTRRCLKTSFIAHSESSEDTVVVNVKIISLDVVALLCPRTTHTLMPLSHRSCSSSDGTAERMDSRRGQIVAG